MAGLLPPDLAAARTALEVVAVPGAAFQLHYAPAWTCDTFPGTAEGVEQALQAVTKHNAAEGIYMTLNPLPPGQVGWARNEDVLRRRLVLIDVDRVKTAADKDLSATSDEHESALALAEEVREYLDGRGWPYPVLHLDSGNGAHLLYRTDLANDREGQRALSAFLKALAQRFGGPHGALDRAVHDARRVSKLPGTWVRKGPDTPQRPHRMARILEANR